VHDALRVDPHEVTVVGEMMNGAQGEAVHDGGDSALVSILDDVSGLNESRLPECAHGAAVFVST
jgi:hypothetical protein